MAEESVYTKAEVVKMMSALAYQLAAPDTAARAMSVVLGAVPGSEHLQNVVSQAAVQSGKEVVKDGKKGGRKAKKEKGSEKKPRKSSPYNIFNAMFFEASAKDPNNPALQAPIGEDGENKRGGVLQLVGKAWKTLSEEEKAKFTEIVSPALESMFKASTESGHKAENQLETVYEFARNAGQEVALRTLFMKALKAGVGYQPGAEANGADKKRKRDAAPAKETKEKKSKHEKEEPAKGKAKGTPIAAPAKGDKKSKKAAPAPPPPESSSDDTSGDDSDSGTSSSGSDSE